MFNTLTKINDSLMIYSDRNAFCIDDRFYSYREFSNTIASIQSVISHLGNNTLKIGIILENNIETYASIFAVWFLGHSFIPISKNSPRDRNTKILKDADVEVILSSTEANNYVIELNRKILRTNNISSTGRNIIIRDRDVNSLAYILFTSGSTGVPKGVPISMNNLDAFIDSFIDLGYILNEKDKFLQMFDLTFDVSIACTIIPLLYGACVYTVPSGHIKFLIISKLLRDCKITVATIVPSLISYLKPYLNQISFPELRYCFVTAEASYISDIESWEKVIPNAMIANLYGPTEVTIWSVAYNWKKETLNKNYNSLLTIGKPLKNVSAIVIDENFKVLQQGEKGELCLAGNQVTMNYLNNVGINKNSFFTKNIDGVKTRFYRTGDLCYFNEDNDLMYCGRADHQVQIQGFRVELGEIENVVRKKFKLKNTLALAKVNEEGLNCIYLFVENFKGNIKEIHRHMKSQLPYYMIPSKIYNLPEFPVNASCKINRKALEEFLSNEKKQ